VPPFEDDICYSVIGKEAPSTCEYLENEKVLHWIKEQMPKIDEECASICSGETTDVGMLNFVYGDNSKADNDDECGNSENISINKNPYLPESIIFTKSSSRYSSSCSIENSPTTSNGYVKVDKAVDDYYCERSNENQTQTTSTTTTSLEGSYSDHYGAPSVSNKTANDQAILDSCSTGDYCDYKERIQDYNQTMSTTVTSQEGDYIDHNSAQMSLTSNKSYQDQAKTFPSITEESLIKDCCDLSFVALSEDSPLSVRSTPSQAGDLDYTAYSITTDSDNNSMLHVETSDYVEDTIAI